MSERFSYSKLSCFETCGFKYKLQYLDKNYAYSASIATEFGTAVHEAEEAIANAIKDAQAIDYISIKNKFILKTIELQGKYPLDYFANDGKSDRNYADKTKWYLNEGIYRLEKFVADHPTYEIVGTEQKFSFDYDEKHNFNGAIDRVFKDTAAGMYLIQDIKTWPVPEDEDKLKTPLQFVVYMIAAKELWGVEPEMITCQYDLPIANMTQDAGTNGFFKRGLKKLNSLFESIEAGNFEPSLSPLCNWCPYSVTNPEATDEFKYLCPYHSLWERTTRNKYEINKGECEWEGLEKHPQILENYKKKYSIIV